MDDAVARALVTDHVIDITTTGRRSGQPRRIETWLYRAAGGLYLTGEPGKRDWLANIEASPQFTLHLKDSVSADLKATGTVIVSEPERRAILGKIVAELNRAEYDYELDEWVADSPLVEFTLVG